MKQLFGRNPNSVREPWNRSHTIGATGVGISLTALVLGFVYFSYNVSLASANRTPQVQTPSREVAASVSVPAPAPASKKVVASAAKMGALHYDQILISPLVKIDPQSLVQVLPIHRGERYTPANMASATDALQFAAGAAGYAFVDIKPRYEINASANTVDVKFEMAEGPRVYVERIDLLN